MCQGSDRLRQSPEMRQRLRDARGALRDQELVDVDEGHPAEGAAEIRCRVRVGEHLVVDLAPEPRVAEDLRARARRCARPRAGSRPGRRASRRSSRCRRPGSARAPARAWNAAHSPIWRASCLTIATIATPARSGAGRGGRMPILLMLPRVGSRGEHRAARSRRAGGLAPRPAREAKPVARRPAARRPRYWRQDRGGADAAGLDYGGTKIEGIVLGPTAPSARAPGCRRRASTTTAASARSAG